MSEPLAAEQLDRLLPTLSHLAEMVKKAGSLNRKALQMLLMGTGLEDEWALDELERWMKVLLSAQEAADAAERELAQRALMLRGVSEAAAMLAVSVVSGGGRGDPMPSLSRLSVSVASLDLGTLPPGQGATAEFEVQGGPGQIVAESDQVQVVPQRFEAGITRVRVEVRPMQSGALWTTLRLVTAGEAVEVPVVAQWTDMPAKSASLYQATDQDAVLALMVEQALGVSPPGSQNTTRPINPSSPNGSAEGEILKQLRQLLG